MKHEDAILTQSMTIEEIGKAILDGALCPSQLTDEQRIAWYNWEPKPVELTSFQLVFEEQRQEFLWEYYWQGEPMLFTAVAHVWDSLEGQREAHGTLVGLISGTGGKGKIGIRRTLEKFLRECLDGCSPLPACADYSSLDQWNDAVRQSCVDDERQARQRCAQYAAILDGRAPSQDKPEEAGVLLIGPWKGRGA